ncbi:MAG: hypothetical protein ACP5FL_07745, partial [Thermoplasmatota archaeon]
MFRMVKMKLQKLTLAVCVILGLLIVSHIPIELIEIGDVCAGAMFTDDVEEGWNKTFGGFYNDEGFSISQTTDGGYIVTGWTFSYGKGLYDVWLIKTDGNGSKEWDTTFGGFSTERGSSVVQTGDSGYIITGWTFSYGAGSRDVWLIKTDANGSKEWDRTFGEANDDVGRSVAKTNDGGYIITGYKQSYCPTCPGTTSQDVWLIKTDGNGSKEWDTT